MTFFHVTVNMFANKTAHGTSGQFFFSVVIMIF